MTTHKAITFSLIMATYNRKDEVESFIQSILKQTFDLNQVELIIVDQNKDNLLDTVVNKYIKRLNIIHIKSKVLGLSVNRNIGINNAKGTILSFPDDDCEYYENTLQTVHAIFSKEQILSTVLGQIVDYSNKKVFRNWPNLKIKVTKNNFYKLNSSITIFTKSVSTYFDERLGIGCKFGSCEDADYLFSIIKTKNKGEVQYNPDILLYHSHPNESLSSSSKIISYGLGFGAFCKKNNSLAIFFVFFQVLVYQFLMFFLSIFKINKLEFKKRFLSFCSIINGFLRFKK